MCVGELTNDMIESKHCKVIYPHNVKYKIPSDVPHLIFYLFTALAISFLSLHYETFQLSGVRFLRQVLVNTATVIETVYLFSCYFTVTDVCFFFNEKQN